MPVDVYIPSCPPRPQAIIPGFMVALDKMGERTGRGMVSRRPSLDHDNGASGISNDVL